MTNQSVGGTTILGDDDDAIGHQYIARPWDLVVMDGGGNDIGPGCRTDVIDRLASPDGATGATVDLVDRIVDDGAGLIVVLGYYPPPDGGAFSACAEQLDTLDARYAALAERHPTVLFLDPGAVIDGNDPSDFDRDLVHPSLSGARKIADLIVSRVEQHRLDVR